MADPASDRGPLGTLTLAGVGAFALAAGRADHIVDELARRLGVEKDDVRAVLGDALDEWRDEARRLSGQTGDMAGRVAAELGLASRDALGELELRVAQLEHRLKLLERAS